MIQTKTNIVFGNRDERDAVLKIEVRDGQKTPTGQEFLVIDWGMDDTKDAFFSKKVFKTNEEINALNDYVEANYTDVLAGLPRVQREEKKLQIALFLDTTTNLLPSGKTIYRQTSDDWEYSLLEWEQPVEEEPQPENP